MDNVKERRRYIRAETPIKVLIRVKRNNKIEEIQTHTKNISATGMLIEAATRLSLNTSVESTLLPSGTQNPIHLNGKITRSLKIEGQNMFSTGIEFTKIEEDNKNTFLKFLCDTIYKLA
jgi:c-di-GMP-binding flagellar brake protein YcgR